MMIWVKLFPLPPEVSQGQPKKLAPEISLFRLEIGGLVFREQ